MEVLANVLFWGLMALVFTMFVYAAAIGYKCPRCGKSRALEKTGSKKKEGKEVVLEEWECKYCEFTIWQDSEDGLGGFK